MMAAVCWAVFGLFACAALPVRAQMVRGRIVDDATGTAVAGAVVVLRDTRNAVIWRTTSGSTGVFLLQSRSAGSYTITVTHVGFVPYTSMPVPLNQNEIAQVTVRLSTAIPLKPLVVHARHTVAPGKLADFERRRRQGVGHFITRAEIDRRPMATVSTLLRRVPRIILERVPPDLALGGGDQYVIAFPGVGVRPCVASVYVDGAHVEQSVDQWLDPYLLAGIEIYPSVAFSPAEYRRANCGVVLFWTRERESLGASARETFRYLAAGAAAVAITAAFLLIR